MADLIISFQIFQQFSLGFIAACGYNQRHHVIFAESLLNPFIHQHGLALDGCFHRIVAVYIRTFLGKNCRCNNDYQKNRGHDITGLVGKFSHEGNLRDKAFVSGLIHEIAKYHNQTWHQQEYGQQA